MYELKCPSCGHVATGSFVRVGAVVKCAGCGQVYRTQEAHVTRRVAATVPAGAGGAGAQDGADALIEADAVPSIDQEADLERLEDPAQETGLTELWDALGPPEDEQEPRIPPPPVLEKMPPASSEQPDETIDALVRSSAERPRRRRRHHGAWLAGALVVVLAVAGTMFWMITQSPHAGSSAGVGPTLRRGAAGATHTGGSASGSISSSSHAVPANLHGLPVIRATSLKAEPWHRPTGERYESPVDYDPRLVVEGARQAYGSDGRMRVMADVSRDPHVQANLAVVSAQLHVALIDVMGQVAARTRVPLGPMQAGEIRTVRVALPDDLVNRSLRVEAPVEVLQTLTDAVTLRPRFETTTEQGRQYLRLTLLNSSADTIERIAMTIEGRSVDGKVKSRFEAMWSGQLPVDQSLRAYVALPMDDEALAAKGVVRWSVEALGGEQSP